jgi:probable addiction module antidote protein
VSGGRPSGSGSRSAKRRTAKRSRKLQPFDAARYLTDDDAVAEYMNAVLETGNLDHLLLALGDIAQARGMAQVAKDTGLGRDSLYKALAPGAKPRFDTVLKVARALGVKLTAQTA